MKFVYLFCFIFLTLQAKSQSRSSSPAEDAPTTRIIKFYPNPATSLINFDFQTRTNESYKFQIFSFVGKKVFELNNISPKTVVNLTDFYRGIYIFQLRDRHGKVVESGKFQVSK